jgi:uncharacterized membrane protein
MTCQVFFPGRTQHLRQVCVFFLVLGCILLIAGCSTLSSEKNSGINTSQNTSQTPGQSLASYKATINQPDARSEYVKMDTDIYNIGEVVEFTVTNDGRSALSCAGDPPFFSVTFQAPNGAWATRMGTGTVNETVKSSLSPGASTQVYRFITTSWEPGRYRILHDCGVEREILVRPLVTLAPTPVACPPVNASNSTPWIAIDPIGNPHISRSFTIQGTTNIPAGQELKYTIFPAVAQDPAQPKESIGYFTTVVQEGSCTSNTWSTEGEIQATGEFVIWISDTGRNTTAIKRFTVVSG